MMKNNMICRYLCFIIMTCIVSFYCNAQENTILKIDNKVMILDDIGIASLPNDYVTMVIGKGGKYPFKYEKAYLYKKYPMYIQVFSTPRYRDLAQEIGATETFYQDTNMLIDSKEFIINNIDYYLTAVMMEENYQNNGKVYLMTACSYVGNKTYRLLTECRGGDYAEAYDIFMEMLRKISLQ